MASSSPAAALPAGGRRGRLSLETLDESRAARAILGVLMAALVAGVVTAIILAFTGHFTNVVPIDAQLSGQGNAVQVGSAVEYRNVTVGKVVSQSPGPGGAIAIKLDIYPANLGAIPAGVTASVSPLSIFGNQYVSLDAPAKARPGHLAAGDFIPADTAAPSDSLQGTVSQLFNLLNAVHPADLDSALTALATALKGEGTNLGKTLVAGQSYLGAIIPALPTLNSDVALLSPVGNDLAGAAPNLVGLLANSAVTAPTITSEAGQLHQLLVGGASVSGQGASLAQQVSSTFPTLVNDSAPVLADISRNPNELSQTLTGLGQWAAAWAAAESHGPFVSLHTTLPISDINAAVEASLGYDATHQIALGLAPAVNPPTYTAADCPQYPGEPNPYCGSGGSPATGSAAGAAPDPAASGPSAPTAAPSPPVMTPAEQQALVKIASALDQERASPGVTTVLLYSLFSSVSPRP